MVKRILLGLLFLIGLTAYSQTNYYVSTDGSDSNDGLSPGAPFLTLAKGGAMAIHPGDTLFLKRGDIWKSEKLTVQASGTAEAPIVITAYGTGSKPIITLRDTIVGFSNDTKWVTTGGNIWKFGADTDIRRLWIDGIEYKEAEDSTVIDATSRWYSNFTDDTLCVYSEGNPGTTYSSIEITHTNYLSLYYPMSGTDKDFIHISYLDLQGGSVCLYAIDCDGWELDSCNIGMDVNVYGLRARASSTTTTSDDWVIKNCIFDNGLRLSVDYYTDAKEVDDGILIEGGCDNWEIYNNYFQDWRHAGIEHLITSASAYETNNLIVHDNYFTAPNVQSGRGIDILMKDGFGTGCQIYNNYSYDMPEPEQIGGIGILYHNNIIDGVRGHIGRPTIKYGGLSIGQYGHIQVKNSEFYNNVIANCFSYGIELVNYLTVDFTGNKFYNNIIYNNDTINGVQIWIEDDSYITANEFKNNLIYKQFHSDSLIYFGADTGDDYYKSVTEFNAENGTGDFVILNNIGGDPDFDGATFELLSTSPAIDAGVDVGLPYFGKAPDIGAYEFTSSSISTTGLGWENHYAKKNFKDDVNFEKGFSVEGVPINFSGGSLVNIPELNILDGATFTTDGTTYSLYDGATQLAPAIPASGQGELSDYVPLLVDATLYFAPCIGVGNDGDTAAFTLNNVIWGAKWEGDHSFVITKVTGVVYGTTPDIDVALLYDTNFRDDTPTEVFSSDLTVTSTTTGDEATISGNNTIAPGTWIWLRVDEATAKPEQLIINIYGYLE